MALCYLMWSFVCPAVRIPCVCNINPGNLSLICEQYYWQNNSIRKSISWEANRCLASQEIPHILWNPKVNFRIHKSPPPVSILSQINPVHALNPSSWRSILIFSCHLRLSLQSGLFPRVSRQNPVCTSSVVHTCYWRFPCHSSRPYYPNK